MAEPQLRTVQGSGSRWFRQSGGRSGPDYVGALVRSIRQCFFVRSAWHSLEYHVTHFLCRCCAARGTPLGVDFLYALHDVAQFDWRTLCSLIISWSSLNRWQFNMSGLPDEFFYRQTWRLFMIWHLQTEHIQDSCLILTMFLIILIYSSRFVPFLCRSEFSQCKLLRCRCLLLYASWSCWLESWGPQVTRLPHVTGVSLTWDLDVLGSLYRLTKPDIWKDVHPLCTVHGCMILQGEQV